MNKLWQNISSKMLRSGSKLYLLIGINVIVFLAINIPAVFVWLFTGSENPLLYYTNEYLLMPAYLPKLLTHFWTPLTYMFMHAGIFHIFFNMLWLYWLGQIFEEYLGNKRILGLYIMGGLAGAFLFVLSYNVFPVFTHANAAFNSAIVGASASVMAVIVATATLLPNYTMSLMFIGPVKLKWLVLVFIIIDFLSITGANSGGEIAHIGGALFGFLYIKQLQKGSDWVGWISNLFKSRSRLRVVVKNPLKKASSRPRQDEVDQILDKISKVGYENLSTEEKEILFRASKNES